MNTLAENKNGIELSREKMIEVGDDLVRLGVCDKQSPAVFSFSPEFVQKLTRMIGLIRILVSSKTPNKKIRAWIIGTMPKFAEEPCRIPLWACRYLLENSYQVKPDTKEAVDDLTDYMCFCHEIIRRAGLK